MIFVPGADSGCEGNADEDFITTYLQDVGALLPRICVCNMYAVDVRT